MAANIYERDLWAEARARSRQGAYKGLRNTLQDSLFILKTISFPGKPAREFYTPTAIAQDDKVVWFVDLNKYRASYDLKTFIDAGCKAFMFRMGGPTRWVQGDWGYAIDASFRPYLEQADRYGVLGQTIGYIVANAFETWNINGATGETIHTELIDDWTAGGYMPAAFCYDHEIHECYTSTGAKITATAHNLKTSLAENTLNTWKKFKRVVSVYSAKWFMNLRADYWLEHDTYFHNINLPEAEGGAGVQRPLMMAWYAQNMSKQYSNVSGVQADLLKPSPEQVGKYLYCGHQANSWQFTDRLKVGTDTVGVDGNRSLDDADTFYYHFGLVKPGTTPDPGPDPNPNPQPGTVEQRLTNVEARQAKLEAWAETIKPYQK